jgi:hypothetical protein
MLNLKSKPTIRRNFKDARVGKNYQVFRWNRANDWTFSRIIIHPLFWHFSIVFRKKEKYYVYTYRKEINFGYFYVKFKIYSEFRQKLVKYLTLTDYYIWNSGNETIHDIDLITDNPLCLTNLGRGIILDIQKSISTNPANGSNAVISNNQRDILINFKYLDPNDALIISILHGGEYSSSIEVKGNIRGIKTIGQFNISIWKFLPLLLIISIVGFLIIISGPQPTQIIQDAQKAVSLAESKEILGLYKPQNSLSYVAKLLLVFLSLFALMFYIYLSSKRSKILNLQSKLNLFENLKIFVKDFF